MITDNEIDAILKVVGICYDQTSKFRGANRRKYFLEDLHAALHNKQTGTMEGVCIRCFGTGYEPK